MLPDRVQEASLGGRTKLGFIPIAIWLGTAYLLSDFGLLAFPEAFLLASLLAFMADYFIRPKAPISFLKWVNINFLTVLFLYLSFWRIPDLTKGWVPVHLMRGLLLVTVSIAYYWFPPLYPPKKPLTFRSWMTGGGLTLVALSLILTTLSWAGWL